MKNWKLWVGIAISAVAIYFALSGIQFDKVGDTFSRINWWLLALSFAPYFVSLFIKVTRWQLLFYPGPQIKLHRLWATLMMSYFFNTVLPARLGEIVRAYALARSEKIGTVRVISTILLEKILDVMTMFIFLLFLLPFLDIPGDLRSTGLLVGGAVVAAFVVCVLMAIYRKRAEAFINWVLRPVPHKFASKLAGFAGEILDVLSVLLNLKLSLNVWMQSIVLWLFTIANYEILSAALNIPLNLQLATLLTIALNLGMAVPSAPGYIGVFESIVIFALLPFFPGQKETLFSLGLLNHLTGFLPVIILGAFYTSREGVSMSKLSKQAETTEITGETGNDPAPVAPASRS